MNLLTKRHKLTQRHLVCSLHVSDILAPRCNNKCRVINFQAHMSWKGRTYMMITIILATETMRSIQVLKPVLDNQRVQQ